VIELVLFGKVDVNKFTYEEFKLVEISWCLTFKEAVFTNRVDSKHKRFNLSPSELCVLWERSYGIIYVIGGGAFTLFHLEVYIIPFFKHNY